MAIVGVSYSFGTNSRGQVVTVRQVDGVTPAQVYSDAAGTVPIPGALLTTSIQTGRVDFYAADGTTYVIAGSGLRTVVVVVPTSVMADSMASLTGRVNVLESRALQRVAGKPIPALGLGATTDITITWLSPMPDASYSVWPAVTGGAAVLGTLSASVKPGSVTADGCVITVKSSALLALGAAQLDVLAYGG